MNKKKNIRKRQYNRNRSRRHQPEPTANAFTLKVFIAFILLLSTLYIKKYDISVGSFNIDTIYEVLYYDEDFNELSNKVFKSNGANAISDLLGFNNSNNQ